MSAVVRDRSKTEKNSFMSGVLVLTLSAIIVKIIGLIYKIPMLRLLGSEGMGYFNSAYEIYALFCSIATTGLPVAMAVVISSLSDTGGAKGVFRAALRIFCCLGVAGCVIMVAFARPFAVFLGNERASYCIMAIAPTVFFICLTSAYRGYFQGRGKMAPTAISQVIEAIGKLFLGLMFALVALNARFSTEVVAAFAVMGLTLGVAASLLYLSIAKRIGKSESACVLPSDEKKGIVGRLLRIAVPVTLSSSVVSVSKVIDMSMILRRLQDIGQSSEAAFASYGIYTTLALPLFSLAPTLVSSIALPLVPSLSSAVSRGDKDEEMMAATNALRLTALISAPASVGLTLFAQPVLELIFSGEENAIAYASPLLMILGFSVMASCFITVGNAILQSYGKAHIPLVSMGVGTALKIAVAWILIGNPNFGLIGAPIGTLVCDIVINSVNFYFIGKHLPKLPIFTGVLLRPFLSAAVSVSVSRVIYNVLSLKLGENRAVTLVSIVIAVALYLFLALISGAVVKDDLMIISFGRNAKKT